MRKIGIPIISVGIIVSAFGTIFFLQGNSIVGPTSSFMYSNPKWIINGLWVAAVGIAIIVIGIWFSLRRRKS
ncbi:MAG: LPXTG cell wall anchor domain-containing protein [Nitrosopumilaceae archaeon]